jgi:hypothetical protein
MKRILILSVLLFAAGYLSGQNLVGFNYGEIKKYMKENFREMNFNSVTNSRFNYLKYTDNTDSQTFLFFLNQDSVCSGVRVIFDPSLKAGKEKELNTLYRKVGDKKWIENRNGRIYNIEMKDEGWSSTITFGPDK